eukprot:gene1826-biopygen12475
MSGERPCDQKRQGGRAVRSRPLRPIAGGGEDCRALQPVHDEGAPLRLQVGEIRPVFMKTRRARTEPTAAPSHQVQLVALVHMSPPPRERGPSARRGRRARLRFAS